MTPTEPLLKPSFYVIVILSIIILSLSALIVCNVFPYSSEYRNFDINVGETYTYDYKINMVNPFFDVNTRPGSNGKFLISTPTPGTYEATITTSSSGEKVGFEWSETFSCNQTVGDKFNRHEEQITCSHWSSSQQYRCVSDARSDCTITMTLGQYERGSELQMYLAGTGKGSVIIKRVS